MVLYPAQCDTLGCQRFSLSTVTLRLVQRSHQTTRSGKGSCFGKGNRRSNIVYILIRSFTLTKLWSAFHELMELQSLVDKVKGLTGPQQARVGAIVGALVADAAGKT